MFDTIHVKSIYYLEKLWSKILPSDLKTLGHFFFVHPLAKKTPNCKFLFLPDSYGYRRRNKKEVPRYKKAKTN